MADEQLSKKEQKKLEKEEKKRKKAEAAAADGEEESEGGTGLVIVAAILIFLVWIAIFALLIKMDVAGIGSTILYPVLKDVPYVNMILPEVEGYAEEDAAYQFDTVDAAVVRIKELEAQLAAANDQSGTDSAYIEQLQAESEQLAIYKANEAAFSEEKLKFYEEVVFSDQAPDINEYKEYYESIEPEAAERIYRQVLEQQGLSDELTDYVLAYSSMKPKEAAEIFNNMTDNLRLVAKILGAMDADARGDILQEMDVETAAAVTKIMEP
ncbi:MAG: hypothetical protein J6N76_07285 [Lachnospiraceae bacterium]|nr:hypothetical protein [Lachnospiraceae bacterium]